MCAFNIGVELFHKLRRAGATVTSVHTLSRCPNPRPRPRPLSVARCPPPPVDPGLLVTACDCREGSHAPPTLVFYDVPILVHDAGAGAGAGTEASGKGSGAGEAFESATEIDRVLSTIIPPRCGRTGSSGLLAQLHVCHIVCIACVL
jgi:hypothetical protein